MNLSNPDRRLADKEYLAFRKYACLQCRRCLYCSNCHKLQCSLGFELCVIPCHHFVQNRLGVRSQDFKAPSDVARVRFLVNRRRYGDSGFWLCSHRGYGFSVSVVQIVEVVDREYSFWGLFEFTEVAGCLV